MKNLIGFLFLLLISSCNKEPEEIIPSVDGISWRTLTTYILPYQDWSTSDVLTQVSNDLDNWSADLVASTTTAMYGTSSTLYNGWDPTIQNPFPLPPGDSKIGL